MTSQASMHAFDDGQALATALATRIADDLRNAIDARGEATIAVSGGSTPKRLFERLSHEVADTRQVIAHMFSPHQLSVS